MSTGESDDRPGDAGAGAEEPLVSPAPADAPAASGASSEPVGSVDSADSDPEPAPQPSAAGGEPLVVDTREPAASRHQSTNMLPQDRARSPVERLLVRLIATCGIVGIGVAIAAIMVSSKSQGWIVGLVVSIVSVILAALLWSSRML